MRILIAPDKFKGSLGAEAVGAAIARGIGAAWPAAQFEIVPLADGGEGTAEAIRRARDGEWIDCRAHDAIGRAIACRYAWLAGERLAVMEMSAVAGLALLSPNERNPLRASTFGVGEMLRDASDRGAKEIILGLGGSATNDGGFGMARALGFRFLDETGRALTGPVSDLLALAQIEWPNDLEMPTIVAACDVNNPLLGPDGATRTFGPQKGASAEQLELLERSLARLAQVTARTLQHDHSTTPGAGAAGGLGFGLLAFGRAQVRSGFEVVADAIDLRARVRQADIVITGEGKLDRQTLSGKTPAGVARMARAEGKPVFAIVGQATDDADARGLFDNVMALNDRSPDFRETARLLETRAYDFTTHWRGRDGIITGE